MSLQFAVVHEWTEDFDHACALADRVLVETVEWLDDDSLPFHREWIGLDDDQSRLNWSSIGRKAKSLRIRINGFIDGEIPQPDAKAAHRAIKYIELKFPRISGMMLIRDQDKVQSRRLGLEQVRKAHPNMAIVIGFAITERECWILSGFDPITHEEIASLADERRKLGFDPRLRSEELTAGADDTATKSPKRVCRSLLCDDGERRKRCWLETPLALLRERGARNGLAAFLSDVESGIAPKIGYLP